MDALYFCEVVLDALTPAENNREMFDTRSSLRHHARVVAMRSPRRRTVRLIGLALLALMRFDGVHASAGQTGTAPAVPVLVELFTAEGCSSCPPADVLLEKMIEAQPASGAEIVALGQHVDYWNQSGWKDRFSSAAFTKRQQLYGAHFRNEDIYTPQMVVDGEAGFVGTDVAAARRAIEHAISVPHGIVHLSLDPLPRDKAAIAVLIDVSGLPGLGRDDPADLIVAVTEDRLRTEVKHGENQGRTLTHAAVVREMRTVGDVTAADGSARATIAVFADWRRENLKIISFVQQRRSRRVLATAALRLDSRQ